MAAIIRIIFIVVVVYYLIRFLDRYVVPYLFGPDKDDRKKRNNKDDEGEYIDYEEVE
jgi:hypothetical protein